VVTVITDPDAYTCSQLTFIDFEAYDHYVNLSNGVAINGILFTASGEDPWVVVDLEQADEDEHKYPDGPYMAQGTKLAFPWRSSSSGGVQGRIDFAYGYASYFSLLTSVSSGQTNLQAYGAGGSLLDTAGPADPNLNTGHMYELSISRAEPDIAYVLVVGQHPVLVDAICTDAPTAGSGTVTAITDPDSYACSQPTFIDFEGYDDGSNLSETGTIDGVHFAASGQDHWVVADLAQGSGKYPDSPFMAQGMKLAYPWRSIVSGARQGRIDFVYGYASHISILTSVQRGEVYLQAYDIDGSLLGTAGPANPNLNTGHMCELSISRAEPNIAYVLVVGQHPVLVDAICTNAPADPSRVHIEVPTTIAGGDLGLFTASGPAVNARTLCPTGVVSDLGVVVVDYPGERYGRGLRILKRFDCDDGSGTFDVLQVVRVDLTPYAKPLTSGRWRVVRGTGRYVQLHGTGTVTGTTIEPGVLVMDTYDGRMR
jgi:hypothetical protein